MAAFETPAQDWASTFFDDGFEETFRLLGKYDSTKDDISRLINLIDLPVGARILDVPCGWGRHAGDLVSRGYFVTGVDSSPAQIVLAKERWPKIDFYVSDMRDAPGSGYDVVLNLWTSFGSLPAVADDLSALAHWCKITRPGGALVMELTTREYAQASNQVADELVSAKHVTTNGVTEHAHFDWVTGVSSNTYSRGDWTRTCFTRLYNRSDLVAMLKDVGYGEPALFGGFDGSPTRDDRRTVIVARKL